MLENDTIMTASGFLISTSSSRFIVPESPCDDPKIRRQCSSARHVGSGHYICDHYNAAVKYPHLLTEFYIEKNEGKQLKDFSPGSKLDIWWYCSKCVSGDIYCHAWPASVKTRGRGGGCPFCNGIGPTKKVCEHENATNNPLLAAEYHECNFKKLYEYSYGSKEEVWWRCSIGCPFDKNCHVWPASIKTRSNGSGCPFCTSGGWAKKVCRHENAANNPLLVAEYHECNIKKLCEYSYGSKEEVWWRCSIGCPFDKNCHVWPASIKTRSNGSGCPFCAHGGSKKKVCEHENATNNLLLAEEWDESNSGKISDYSYGSAVKAWWRCSKTKDSSNPHKIWPAIIKDRNNGNGCPQCRSSKGEEMIVIILTNLIIPFQREYSGISELGMKRFDFAIQNGKFYYLIEFDGIQHFEDVEFFNKKRSLEQHQHIDIIKHLTALKYGFKMIRLDHTLDMIEEIFRHHITTALAHSNTSYYTTPSLYGHIISAEKEFLTLRHLYPIEQLSQFIEYLANKYTKNEETIIIEF